MKLQTKFLVAFVPALFLAGGGMILLANRIVHKIILEQVARRGWSELQNLELRSMPGFQRAKEQLLLPVLETAAEEAGAVYAAALDNRGRVLAHTNIVEKGKIYNDPLTREILHTGYPLFRPITMNGSKILDVTWPVHSHRSQAEAPAEDFLISAGKEAAPVRLGVLRIGLPLAEALATEAKIAKQLMVLLFFTGSLVLALAMLLMQGILQPVRHLAAATEQIGLGRYGAEVPILSGDELGDLARSFNRMSQALAQTTVSKDFLDRILENMLDPLIVLEPDGRIRLLNRATLELLGYASGELLGQSARNLFASYPAVLDTIGTQGFVKNIELNFASKSGRSIPVFFSGSIFKDKAGQTLGIILVAKDITERKKMEDEIIQAEKLSAVGRLASGVAHEINNPLGVILGFAQGALWDIAPGDPMEFPLRSIERESNRCKHLVQDLLTFSRITKTDREPIDLNDAVESAFSLVTAQARLGRVNVVKELEEDLPRLLGNQNQIQQIIINLANNALDAMSQNGTLTVRTQLVHEGSRPWVGLFIADTGSGIPPDILPRIFEPFFTTKPAGQGTGLGLGLVHEIVKKHSGTIDVQSRPGFTEFCIKFPVRADAPSSEAAA
jgi:PAS domain S-box-containing protein